MGGTWELECSKGSYIVPPPPYTFFNNISLGVYTCTQDTRKILGWLRGS